MIPSWLRLLANKWFPARSRRRSAAGRRRRSASLEVEPLEQRCVPATVTWTGALMADPDTSKSGQDLDGDNRWSARGTRNGVVVTNWDNPFIVGRSDDFPHNGDTIVFPTGAVKVGQALYKDSSGVLQVSDALVHGQGPRNDLFDIGFSTNNTLNVVTVSDSGYTIFNDPNSPGPDGSIRLNGNFIADMSSGISTWAIGITIPPAPGGNTP